MIQNLENLFPSTLRTQLQLHFQLYFQCSLGNTLTQDVIMTTCRTETGTVSRMQKDGPFDCCGVTIFCACVRPGSRWTFWAHFCDGFTLQCLKIMPTKFLHLWLLQFGCSVCHQNVVVWNVIQGKVEDNHSQTRSCFLNCYVNKSAANTRQLQRNIDDTEPEQHWCWSCCAT